MKQYLLNSDGSFPLGAPVSMIRQSGVLCVIPTLSPSAVGMVAVEGKPAPDGENWLQTWSLLPAEAEPIPEPENQEELIVSFVRSLTDEQRAAFVQLMTP